MALPKTSCAQRGARTTVTTVSQFFQPPLYWQQFEDLAHGMLGEAYSIPDAQQYGRTGQAQNGVDVFGRSRKYGWIGIQCKRLSDLDKDGNPYPGGPITRKFFRDAATEALAFQPSLSIWILATTARRDTKVQGWVNQLNDEWASSNRDLRYRRAIVWSWDECIAYLNSFPELQRWYYKDVIQVRGTADLDKMILQTIALAFSRPAFEVPLLCESPAEFLQALSDTQRAVRTGELLDRESRHVIRKSVGGWRDLGDREARDGLDFVDKRLRQLRSKLEQGRKDKKIREVDGFLDFTDSVLARELEDLRGECVNALNGVLSRWNLPTV
ncbi:hypothetical protein DFR52_102517 [Hoeflea marina]|uniref:Restriction endonuclease n=1 Tax=Hoeflea marina TaxID=274592 RepID=A0A317PMV6_9HYPH|nr:hypothetical protein DFR52_102517 [Hoeflea marina]